MRILCIVLNIVAGCTPPLTVDNNIGAVKSSLFDNAAQVLKREGIRVEGGDHTLDVTGIRVPPEDAFRATKILVEWRRDKAPGAFFTREEFRSQIED